MEPAYIACEVNEEEFKMKKMILMIMFVAMGFVTFNTNQAEAHGYCRPYRPWYYSRGYCGYGYAGYCEAPHVHYWGCGHPYFIDSCGRVIYC